MTDWTTTHHPDQDPEPEGTQTFSGDTSPLSHEADRESLGAVIAGRYTLAEVIGEGGMGSVYRAEQSEPVRRQVALKLIKRGMDSRRILARFGAERQALALMDHPGIARVFDGGTTETGQPFFVMELVQGVPITRYCDEKRLSVAARLDLFVAVCNAVQHAHQKGIIHRDLKPGNVLVTEVDGRPVPKVIDFGVAKATQQQLTDESIGDEGLVVGTPEYMSPEQADPSGEDIDTRSDVYALGVILYELLVGSTPIEVRQLRRGAVLEMLRMVREVEPPRPSTKLSTADTRPNIAANRSIDPGRLSALLRSELDWIVLKSLEKDRARRYDSASDFARDVQRYLQGDPIEARPPSRGYLIRKFVGRHRGQVVAATLVLVALVTGMVGTSIGMVQAERARAAEAEQRGLAEEAAQRERNERQRAEQVAALMESVFSGIDPEAASELGISFEEQLTSQIRELATGLETLQADPIARAHLQVSLAGTLMGLGEYEQAASLFEQSVQSRREHGGQDDPDAVLAELGQAGALTQLGRFDEALALIESLRARGDVAKAAGESDDDLDHLEGMIHQGAGRIGEAITRFEAAWDRIAARGEPDTADSLLVLHTLGAAYRQAGRDQEAIAILRDVRARRSALLGPDHRDTRMSTNSLAVACSAAGRYAEAIDLLQGLRAQLADRFPADHPSVLISDMNLGMALFNSGRREDGLAMLEDAHRRAIARYGPSNLEVVKIELNLAAARFRAGDTTAAIELLEHALPVAEKSFSPHREMMITARSKLAQCYQSVGRVKEARDVMTEAVERVASVVDPDDDGLLGLRENQAMMLRSLGEPAAGAEILEDVRERRVRLLGAKHPSTLQTLHDLGCCYFSMRRPEDAIALFEPLLEERRAQLGPDDPRTLETQGNLGSAYWAARKLDRSVPLLEDTLRREEATLGAGDPATLSTAIDLAINYGDAGKADQLHEHLRVWLVRILREKGDQAISATLVRGFLQSAQQRGQLGDTVGVLEVGLENVRKARGADDPETLRVMNNLGAAYWGAGELEKSIPLFEELVERSTRVHGEGSAVTLGHQANLAKNLLDAGRAEEAVAIIQESLALARSGSSEVPQSLEFMVRDLGAALARSGQPEQALQAVRDAVAASRRWHAAGSRELAGQLVTNAMTLIEIGQHAEAEALLREALAVRESIEPKLWSTANTRSLLGGALSGQGRFEEAEPLLLSGYEGMKSREDTIPYQGKKRIPEAAQRLADHFAARHAADPDAGHDARAREWSERAGPPR